MAGGLSMKIAIIFVITTCMTAASCQSKMRVTSVQGKKPTSAAEPTEIKDGLNLNRTYVQSRTPITIVISADTMSTGNYFSLLNDSNKKTLVADQAFSLTDESTEGFAVTDPAPELELSGYELTLKIYPLDSSFKDKFTVGTNALRVYVKSDSSPKQAKTNLTRKDFSLFALAGGSFTASAGQRSSGIELYPGTALGQPSVTNGKRVLITDPISLMNR